MIVPKLTATQNQNKKGSLDINTDVLTAVQDDKDIDLCITVCVAHANPDLETPLSPGRLTAENGLKSRRIRELSMTPENCPKL